MHVDDGKCRFDFFITISYHIISYHMVYLHKCTSGGCLCIMAGHGSAQSRREDTTGAYLAA